jgi:hypothetical protein
MNSAKVIEIIKKNLLSVLCGVVALVAIIATFWPVGGFFAELQTLTEQRAAQYGSLQTLLTKPRQLPLTDPAKTVQDPLQSFPTEPIIAEGDKATKGVSAQSKKMVENVVAMNRANHPLLVPDALPNPQSDAPKFRFRDLYKLVLSTDPNMSVKTNPYLQAAKQSNLWNDVLNGGIPPTDVEIGEKEKELWDNEYSIRIIYSNNQAINLTDVTASYNAAKALVPGQMKSKVATEKKVYISPDAFTLNPNVVGSGTPNPYDIWNAQLHLWIQQDVAAAIAQANAKAQNILDAPVKRLLKLTIPLTPTPYVMAPAAAGAPGTAPPPAAPVENGDITPLPKVPAVSPAGRVCNPMYDVVHFTLVIDVDASQIPFILASLSQNRLIDVYNMDVLSVDTAEEQKLGFLYGPRSVVELNLQCEALFMRSWTVPWMPDQVKKQLGIASPAPGAPGMPQASVQY